MKKLFLFITTVFLTLSARPVAAEILSIEGRPAKVRDIIQVPLRDLHPTQPSIGFDRVFYKLGRYEKDRRKMFDDYCVKNGRMGILDFTDASDLHDLNSFTCQQAVGTNRDEMKTVVISPNGDLYLTDGHHTFNGFWQMKDGGPDLLVNLIVTRDYRDLKNMDSFWEQMKIEQNVWLYDVDGHEMKPSELPQSLGLKNFSNDQYRSMMYFTRRVAWTPPGEITVPDPDNFDDRYPDVPFLEFYWAQEVRKLFDISHIDLSSRAGYVTAIRALGAVIMTLDSNNIGGSNKSSMEMGQFRAFNERELARLDRPGTGKIAYMLSFKSHVSPDLLKRHIPLRLMNTAKASPNKDGDPSL